MLHYERAAGKTEIGRPLRRFPVPLVSEIIGADYNDYHLFMSHRRQEMKKPVAFQRKVDQRKEVILFARETFQLCRRFSMKSTGSMNCDNLIRRYHKFGSKCESLIQMIINA